MTNLSLLKRSPPTPPKSTTVKFRTCRLLGRFGCYWQLVGETREDKLIGFDYIIFGVGLVILQMEIDSLKYS